MISKRGLEQCKIGGPNLCLMSGNPRQALGMLRNAGYGSLMRLDLSTVSVSMYEPVMIYYRGYRSACSTCDKCGKDVGSPNSARQRDVCLQDRVTWAYVN